LSVKKTRHAENEKVEMNFLRNRKRHGLRNWNTESEVGRNRSRESPLSPTVETLLEIGNLVAFPDCF